METIGRHDRRFPQFNGERKTLKTRPTIPTGFAPAIQELVAKLDAKKREEMRAMSEDAFTTVNNETGLGYVLRTIWNLGGCGSEGTPLHDWFVTQGVESPIDMSEVLLRILHRSVLDADLNLGVLLADMQKRRTENEFKRFRKSY